MPTSLVVYAKTDPDAGPRGITAFLVEKGFKGFSFAQKLDKLGMRGSDTCELVFEDCEVPAENVLGAVGGGVDVLMSGPRLRARRAGGRAARHHAGLPGRRPALCARAPAVRPADRRVPARCRASSPTCTSTLNASRAYVYTVGAPATADATTRKDAAGAILYAAEQATWMALEAIQLSAATAISTTTRPGACCATPSCTKSAPAPAKSAAC